MPAGRRGAGLVDAALRDLDRAAGAGADELHIVTNLPDVPPERQADLLEALAAKLDLPTP
ncbi:hypothetical protein F8568_027765 [Actinomadura sp. LD22]|uniref:Uncharacterized protein n=1 Tax=Actinomadura physcomitrii TaxID=2650748 RepID=A0A6I4MEF0_9ACTN|nr:hypothetical protein [Actinomadura physcomitrii]MWA04113.1 hypothetical protein [Actinomadura physcomitrii]